MIMRADSDSRCSSSSLYRSCSLRSLLPIQCSTVRITTTARDDYLCSYSALRTCLSLAHATMLTPPSILFIFAIGAQQHQGSCAAHCSWRCRHSHCNPSSLHLMMSTFSLFNLRNLPAHSRSSSASLGSRSNWSSCSTSA